MLRRRALTWEYTACRSSECLEQRGVAEAGGQVRYGGGWTCGGAKYGVGVVTDHEGERDGTTTRRRDLVMSER